MRGRRIRVLATVAGLIGSTMAAVLVPQPASAGTSVGSFEIDGNTPDSPAGEPTDWDAPASAQSPPLTVTPFTDGTGNNDDGFGMGSKQEEPGAWACINASSPGKGDITPGGKIAFRTIGGKQFVYVNFTRKTTTGSADIDYEFSQSSQPNPSCPSLPLRTAGDILLAFDAENGGKTILVRAFEWTGSSTIGTFAPLATGSQGVTWDGATNGDGSNKTGNFGEAVLNLTDTIGNVTCGEFSSVYMKSRSSVEINSALQDRTATKPVATGLCPVSSLKKAVRNTAPGSPGFGTTANAKPGDTLEYRLTYENTGQAPATNVVVTDVLQQKQTLVASSCVAPCSYDPGTRTLTWTLGTINNGAPPTVLTFQVTLDATFPAGDTPVTNQGSVDTGQEPPTPSNTTTTTVHAAAVLSSTKSVSPTSAAVGATVTYTVTVHNTGDADGTTTVTDNYDQAHIDPLSISDNGVDNGDTIVWANVSVAAKSSKTFTYTAMVIGTYSGSNGTCPTGQFPVVNQVSIVGGTGSSATLCVIANPVLTTDKTVSPTSANVGQTVAYSIKITNTGAAPGTTTVVDDYDQAHITVSNISNGGVDNGNTITWTNITVPALSSVTLTYSGLVKGTFTPPPGSGCGPGQFPVVNTVTITGGTGDTNTLCVNASPVLTTDKTVTPTTASVGQTVAYSIKITNSGDAAGTTTVVDDYDQAHITVSNISNGGVDNGNTITWTNISVPAKGSVTLTYSGLVKGTFTPPPGSGCGPGQFPVVNTVTITGGTGDTNTLCVNAAPVLSSTKTVNPTSANVGQTVAYTITVNNTGDAVGTTTVTDDYDQTHITVSNISNGGVDNGDTITWTNITVPAKGSVLLTYSGLVKGTFTPPPGSGCGPGQFPVLNNVSITGGTGSSAKLCVNAAPNLSTDKTVTPTSANVGQTVAYSIKITNSGPATGTTTVVDDYDQAHLTVSNISNGGVDNGNTITWTNITVPALSSVTLTYSGLVKGTFTPPPGSGCGPGQFPVVNQVTITGGTGDTNTLCVNAAPNLSTDKTVTPTSANIGQTVAYKITITNSGDAAGTTTVVDNYDQAHITVSNISNGGVDNGDTITWTNITVPAKGNVVLTYSGTVKGTFSGPPGGGGCGPGQFPVVNQVTITGGTGDINTLCVNAPPNLTISKAANKTSVVGGDSITYTLTYGNTGSSPATGTQIVETVPTGTNFSSCTGGCVVDGSTVTWSIGTVNPGGGGSVTLTVEVRADVNTCSICNTAQIKSPDQNGGLAVNSNQVCVLASPGPDPSTANANGDALGLKVYAPLLGIPLVNVSISHAASTQTGPGQAADDDNFVSLDILGVVGLASVAHADVLTTTSASQVTAATGARQTSTSEVLGLNVLSGVVTADAVRSVASTTASGTASSFSAAGTTLVNLKVLGSPVTDTSTNVKIPLDGNLVNRLLYGRGSYVAVNEQTGTTSGPASGQLSGGIYKADLTVTAVRVVVTGGTIGGLLTLGGPPVEVTIAKSVAHSEHKQTTLCPGATRTQAVSGHAFIASAQVDPLLSTSTVGYVEIPASGGSDHEGVAASVLPADGSVVTTADAVADSTGTNGATSSTASSYAQTAGLCVLKLVSPSCLISATLIRSQANSSATASSRSSNATGTQFVNLVVAGIPIAGTPPPNTTITLPLGLGYVVLNEQVPDGPETGHTGLTVRAIRVKITGPFGILIPGAEVIVAEAHSDATFR